MASQPEWLTPELGEERSRCHDILQLQSSNPSSAKSYEALFKLLLFAVDETDWSSGLR